MLSQSQIGHLHIIFLYGLPGAVPLSCGNFIHQYGQDNNKTKGPTFIIGFTATMWGNEALKDDKKSRH